MKCSNVKSVKGEFMDVRKGPTQINTQIEGVLMNKSHMWPFHNCNQLNKISSQSINKIEFLHTWRTESKLLAMICFVSASNFHCSGKRELKLLPLPTMQMLTHYHSHSRVSTLATYTDCCHHLVKQFHAFRNKEAKYTDCHLLSIVTIVINNWLALYVQGTV